MEEWKEMVFEGQYYRAPTGMWNDSSTLYYVRGQPPPSAPSWVCPVTFYSSHLNPNLQASTLFMLHSAFPDPYPGHTELENKI